MKSCPSCGRLYPLEAGFCPVDGQQLVNVSQAPVANSSEDKRIGATVCGRYQVRRVVADGGMGRVYEALDLETRHNVALKILHPEVANDTVAVERFRREFDVSKHLSHEHVVEVHDFQPTEDGSYALVMEFLYGEELRNALKRETVLPPARIVRMLAQLAVGLDAAHDKKLVHRDLKPDNVFLCQTRDGDIVKILDFGSVKDKAETAKKLTVIGTTIGSPFYMAPEQAQGLETLDHRADVWALAAITYECMTGQVPFGGINGPSILLEILTKSPVPPSQRAADQKYAVPPMMDRVMAQAFQKNPGMRTSSVGELADRVGEAYGLVGTHHDWIVLTQSEVEAQIAERLPAAIEAWKGSQPAETALDDFFGDGGSILDQVSSVAATQRVPAPVATETRALGVPSRSSRWMIPTAVAGVLLLLVVAVAMLFVL
ncbi:MAG TPA: serine/threonine-protein kinase [Polyangiaceae bacterium]